MFFQPKLVRIAQTPTSSSILNEKTQLFSKRFRLKKHCVQIKVNQFKIMAKVIGLLRRPPPSSILNEKTQLLYMFFYHKMAGPPPRIIKDFG